MYSGKKNERDDFIKPLEGLKIVELGMYLAAPGVARLLGDWGAEVIKVESVKGDSARYSGIQVRLPALPDCNIIFSIINSGKKFLSLDLKAPEGMEVMQKLLAEADIFVSNTRYGGLSRLGLDYETLHTRYPKLVCCYINGYGFEGEERDKAGFDLTCFWSKSGILNAMRQPGEVPRFPPPGIGDISTSFAAAAGILAAIYQRSVTGEGTKVSTSLLATAVWSNYSHIASGQDRPEGDTRKPLHTPEPFKDWKNPFYHIYKCKDDRLFFLLGGSYSQLPQTLHVLGLDELIGDPRYADHYTMMKNSAELYDRMIEIFLTKTSSQWAAIFEPLDISFEILAKNNEVSKDPQVWANGCLTRMECPNGSTYVVSNTPVEFAGAERTQTRHAGRIGSDTRGILASLGYTPEQIEDLLQKGIAKAT